MKRVKRRYLALQLEMDSVPSEKELMGAIWGAVTRLHGEVGASLTSMALINFDASHKVVVIRTSLETLDIVRASIACITNITDKLASMHILAISGTIKALLKQL